MNDVMDDRQITLLGDDLFVALSERTAIDPLTLRHPELTLENAYAIQQHLNRRRLAAGHRAVGRKIGVTSEAVMNMLGVRQPDFGLLTDAMHHADGSEVAASAFIQPRIEAEIAFRLRRDLSGTNVAPEAVLDATECVMACFEIVDSRIRDWKINIQDTVADNASCGAFVLGRTEVDPRNVDLIGCAMQMRRGGVIAAEGKGAATMGSPLNAVSWLASTLSRLGDPLRAGEIVLSGALGAMVPVKAGDDFHMRIAGIGECGVRFD